MAQTCEVAARWSDNAWVIDGLRVQFDGVDAHRERARTTGANVLRGPEDVPGIGVRLYTAEDVEGHRSTFVESVVS